MGLSWRDAVATLFVVGAAAVSLSVANGWDWPLIGDARAGAIGVLVLGFAASVTGGGPQWFVAALRREVSTKGMWLSVFASVMGFVTLGLLIANFLANSIPLLLWATVALLVLWVVATMHHVIEARPQISLIARRTSN